MLRHAAPLSLPRNQILVKVMRSSQHWRPAVTIPANPAVVGDTQGFFAGGVYGPSVVQFDQHDVRMMFAEQNFICNTPVGVESWSPRMLKMFGVLKSPPTGVRQIKVSKQ